MEKECQFEEYLTSIKENKTDIEILENLEALEGLSDFEELIALLALPDDIFEQISEPFLLELEKALNQPQTRLQVMNSLKADNLNIDDFINSIPTALKEIEESQVSEVKKDFMKRLIMSFSNVVTSNTTSVRRIFTIPIELCHPDAKIPTYANLTDAGMDVYALEDITVNPGETVLVKTGIKVAIPDGYELQVRPKSGISLKTKLRVANTPGTVDTGYRDEIGVIIENIEHPIQDIDYEFNAMGKIIINSILHGKSYTIEKGQKIAQLVLCEVPKVIFQEVENIGEIAGDRGGGFGSTGLK